MTRTSLALTGLLVGLLACSHPSQVSFVANERPNAPGATRNDAPPTNAAQAKAALSTELPSDEELVEPERPAAGSKQERALVHIHTPNGTTCSGVVLGPKIVATAQQCLEHDHEGPGLTTFEKGRSYTIEIASSALTWTRRTAVHALAPACDWKDLDVAMLVLAEPTPFAAPLRVVSAPATGAKVQALGFGHCRGDKRPLGQRTAEVRKTLGTDVIIDAPLCRGDVGGPVVDGSGGDVFGLISHRDDPEGSPLRTTTIARIDVGPARELLAQANALAEKGTKPTAPVACH